jgi:hypothetical protein
MEQEKLLQEFDGVEIKKNVEAEYAARYGKSVTTLYRDYYAYMRGGIIALVPEKALSWAGNKKQSRGLSPEFVDYFKMICESITTPSVPQARRMLLQRIRRGDLIPGFGTWKEMWAEKFPGVPAPAGVEYPRDSIETVLPEGLSCRNLNRHKGELFDLVSARQGTFAASKYGPMVYTTRVGCKVGQVLIFDDVWHNQNVNWPGSTKALRPLELCCLDLVSAHKVAWGMRPRIWNPETQKHEGIKEHEFRFLLAYTLCEEVGYRPDGTILWLERGTAAIDEVLADIISRLSGGAITVKRAPLKDARQLCSMYKSVSSGNPRFKAPLESHHNAAHTALSAITGQIGRSAEMQPEEIAGRDKDNNLLLKLAAVLPRELAARLQMPFLHWDEYMPCVVAGYDAMADRRDHSLEGWNELGFFDKEFWIPGTPDFVSLETLKNMPADVAGNLFNILADHPEFCRCRFLSPIEVWRKHKRELKLIPKCGVPLILGPKNGVIRTCPQTAELVFGSRLLGPSQHIYSREYLSEDGFARRIDAGMDYLFHINPFSPSRDLFISTVSGEYLGCSSKINVPARVDQDAVLEQIKRKRAEYARLSKSVSGRHLTQLAASAMQMQNNGQIIMEARNAGLLQSGCTPDAVAVQSDHEDCDADAALLEMYG